MEVLQIDLKGKMAHFRKYYANNTSLSFSIPPRTTISGMLAAILGLPKDEYYSKFSSDKIRIGISLRSPVKKTFHRLNFLRVTSLGNLGADIEKSKPFRSDFRGTGGNIQTPFEIITGYNLQCDEICYRIFVSAFDTTDPIFDLLKEYTLQRRTHYNLSFGIAGFAAYIDDVHLFTKEKIAHKKINNQEVILHSAVISDKITALHFEKDDDSNFVEEELMPADFIADNNREISKMNRVLFTHHALPLKVSYSGDYYILDDSQSITFLENE
ncbi:CRISPR-associated protein Cas5 [Chitinophaga sp. 30R24]|uniref:CRISPR-associated protein Cas5 n=1 Tax=Chitinophaga sp. 30R24 TaxID=3248838 RepID=UPI003B911190